jgi:NADPH-dependent glutamate synthase beta subunit-like oxidoreductase/Pyruvate/2-oxoacid:ferredoxin oxidoreductase delta subunit
MTAVLPPTAWTTGSTEVFKTGTWRAALPQYVSRSSPCRDACPVNGDIAAWIGHARSGDLRRAWEVLTVNNPFPAIAGRICHHPCESACNRAEYDEAVSVCRLERAVGDAAVAAGWRHEPPAREREGHVAVLGGGPSGLSAAYQLRRRGWRVTIYELRDQLGGLMRYGIPPYRLPREVLDAEIARIVAMGVNVRPASMPAAGDAARPDEGSDAGSAAPPGTGSFLAWLRANHDAVYVATGAATPKRLPQLPSGAAWLMQGADYLARCNTGEAPHLGRRVVVIGGGSAAMDVARSARRQGHDVTVLALEKAAAMPAQREEVHEALEEGVALADGAMLQRVVPQANGTLHVECVLVNFEAGAVRGSFRVTPVAGTEFTIEADAVVPAIGQDPDLGVLDGLPAQGALLDVDGAQATGVARVWAGGDVASMARFVTEAVGMGKRAAIDIDRELRGEPAPARATGSTITLGEIATWYHPHGRRPPEARRGVEERLGGNAEVQLALAPAAVHAEASRCFSCGTCTSCDNCFQFCPDLAVKRVNGAYEILADYCKGCGVCVRECTTGAMLLTEERR